MLEAVEGVEAAPALLIRAQGLSCPVTEGVAAVLAGRMTVAEALAAVLARPEREE